MDIVIPLGTESSWDNNELRYTLRSVEKYLTEVDNVVIVGEKPSWLHNIIHIPAVDSEYNCRDRNIMEKILKACADSRVADSFLCMSDDHFLLKEENIELYPIYSHGTLYELVNRAAQESTYRQTIINTISQLTEKGKTRINYNLHCPIHYSKTLFRRIMKSFDWTVQYGLLSKSLYYNYIDGHQYFLNEMPDCKIKEPLSIAQLEAKIAGRPFFSIGDDGLTDQMKKFINALYPVKSKYEK